MAKSSVTSVLIVVIATIFIPLRISNGQSLSQGTQINPPKQEPQFAPDVIIVKLTQKAYERMSISTDADKNVVTGLDSLDKLHKKYGAKKMEPLSPKGKGVEIRLETLSAQITKLEGKKKLSPEEENRLQRLLKHRQNLLKRKDVLRKLQQERAKTFKITIKQGLNILEAVSEYQNDPNIEYAEPNYIYHISN